MCSKVVCFILILLIIILALPTANTVHALGVIATIAVGAEPSSVAYDPHVGEIFVTNFDDNTVSVISDSTDTVVATIPVGNTPSSVAYDSGKDEVFVVSPDSISVISDSNNAVIETIPTGGVDATYDSGKNEIFVTALGYPGGVSVIADSNNTVIATIPVGTNPWGLAYDSGMNEIFVANHQDNSVSVISDVNNSVVATIPAIGTSEPSAGGAMDVAAAYDPAKGEVFVANYVSNTVAVISDSNDTVISTIYVGQQPDCLAYDSGKGEIFVSNLEGTVSVIPDSSDALVATATIPVGRDADSVAYDSGKEEIFVANQDDNTVSVISDSSTFAAPSVYPSTSMVTQGQALNLTSASLAGDPPYVYQWFSEGPGSLSYKLIKGAPQSSYVFDTSNSTATGNWSFMLQVTDSTGAAVNSTVSVVTVNAQNATASSSPSPTASSALSQAATSSPTPIVPEFSTAAIVLLLFLCVSEALILAHRKASKSPNYCPLSRSILGLQLLPAVLTGTTITKVEVYQYDEISVQFAASAQKNRTSPNTFTNSRV